ncbi:hypothetical protein GCM10007096_18500 [Pullulanibacillus pueri]|uniref:Uncharacterized protein n=1 Tax=Pullulanibacillus pueri TaxID=1437324 RepID=A0A8J3EML2_9BACL|nr:hypothetical protein GCM10007096_18500 [Pullulanibacillus pueri]
MFFLYAILFLVFGYVFILSFIKAIKGEASSHFVAFIFIMWVSLSIIVTVNLISL